MKDIEWLPGLSLPIDPDASLDYEFDASQWLDGESMSSATVTGVNCDVESRSSAEPHVVVVRVSNAQPGAKMTVRIASYGGQTDDFTVSFRVRNR